MLHGDISGTGIFRASSCRLRKSSTIAFLSNPLVGTSFSLDIRARKIPLVFSDNCRSSGPAETTFFTRGSIIRGTCAL
jgi:hypothetical protein